MEECGRGFDGEPLEIDWELDCCAFVSPPAKGSKCEHEHDNGAHKSFEEMTEENHGDDIDIDASDDPFCVLCGEHL